MLLSDFDYDLPASLIAQYPLKDREKCRLLVLDRPSGTLADRIFEDIAGYIGPKDLLVLNDTRVIPARLYGKRRSGGKVEIFLMEKSDPLCEALVRPAARLKAGEEIVLESGDVATILERGPVGTYVRFDKPVSEVLERAGHMPLPPYVDRRDEAADRDRYQTVYGTKEGATASPTAGLHFSPGLIERIRGRGSGVAFVTLHTNYGTFAPVKTDAIEDHRMHKERFELPAATIEAVRQAKRGGGKVFAVGTTSTRVLEHNAALILDGSRLVTEDEKGSTGIYLYPGYDFKVVDCLITNFHMPKSTLMILVSAFAGRERIMKAYRHAIESGYRFFSYGDAMLIT